MATRREQILDALRTQLATITTGNGYENDIVNVQRWKQRGNSVQDTPCIVIAAGEETKNPTPNPLYTCDLPVFIDVWLAQEEDDETATDTLLSSLLGDVEKCVMANTTLGGLANDILIRGNAPFEGIEGSPHAGIVVIIQINYEHLFSDPSSAS